MILEDKVLDIIESKANIRVTAAPNPDPGSPQGDAARTPEGDAVVAEASNQ
jgi:hypothetical protein